MRGAGGAGISGLLRGAGGAGGAGGPDGAAGRHAAGDCLQPHRGVSSHLIFYPTTPRLVAAALAPLNLLRPGPDAAEHSGRRWREASVSRCVVRH